MCTLIICVNTLICKENELNKITAKLNKKYTWTRGHVDNNTYLQNANYNNMCAFLKNLFAMQNLPYTMYLIYFTTMLFILNLLLDLKWNKHAYKNFWLKKLNFSILEIEMINYLIFSPSYLVSSGLKVTNNVGRSYIWNRILCWKTQFFMQFIQTSHKLYCLWLWVWKY